MASVPLAEERRADGLRVALSHAEQHRTRAVIERGHFEAAVKALAPELYRDIRTTAYAGLGDEGFRQVLKALVARRATPTITAEMVREALAHCPLAQRQEPTAIPRWEWLADYLTRALAQPDKPCACCGVTPAGEIHNYDSQA